MAGRRNPFFNQVFFVSGFMQKKYCDNIFYSVVKEQKLNRGMIKNDYVACHWTPVYQLPCFSIKWCMGDFQI